MTPDQLIPRPVVSFARRDGRILRRHQKAWDDDHAEYFIVPERSVRSVSVDPGWRCDPAQSFPAQQPVVIEVGSGTGEALLQAAAEDPGRNYLGLEVYRPGLARTVVHARRMGLQNLRMCEADAAEFLSTAWPRATACEVRVFFPDPWPKLRHHKRRLVSEQFRVTVAQALEPRGTLWLATDWCEYAQHMKEALQGPEFELVDELVRAPGQTEDAWPGRIISRFERKAAAAGRGVTDLKYRRLASDEGVDGPTP